MLQDPETLPLDVTLHPKNMIIDDKEVTHGLSKRGQQVLQGVILKFSLLIKL